MLSIKRRMEQKLEQALRKKPKVDIEEQQSSMVSNIAKNRLEIRLDLRYRDDQKVDARLFE